MTIGAQAGFWAAAFLLAAGGSARASTMEVKVPFSFVVHGRTLPAGQYLVTDENGVIRLTAEKGGRADVFVMTLPAAGHDPAGDTPALTFQRYEKQNRLADVWLSSTEGRVVSGS